MRQVKLQKKINSATNKAKELGILNDKPKVKGTGSASSYQPTKVANDGAARYKLPAATVSKPKQSNDNATRYNVPMGSGSKSKPSSSESSYKSKKNER